jgi:addiction module RelE/StbE family toxin
MEVRWSQHAYNDLERIFRHISMDSQGAAREVVRVIYEECTLLKTLPNRGRPGRIIGRRELVFPSLPYIAVYQVKENLVEISRIYHSAQNWP